MVTAFAAQTDEAPAMPQDRFAKCPWPVVLDRTLSDEAFVIYTALTACAWKGSLPSQAGLAAMTGINRRRRLRPAIAKLEAAGLLAVTREKGRADRYLVLTGDGAAWKSWARMPDAVTFNGELSAGARRLYALLLLHAQGAGWCEVFQGQLSRELGVSGVSTSIVRRRLRELKGAGLVKVEECGRGRPARYVLESGVCGAESDRGRYVPGNLGRDVPGNDVDVEAVEAYTQLSSPQNPPEPQPEERIHTEHDPTTADLVAAGADPEDAAELDELEATPEQVQEVLEHAARLATDRSNITWRGYFRACVRNGTELLVMKLRRRREEEAFDEEQRAMNGIGERPQWDVQLAGIARARAALKQRRAAAG